MTHGTLILVVEDNEANQLLASSVLERAGYQIALASDSVEALDAIRRNEPDLILMDIQLPGQDGLTFTRELKADPSTAAIPIVALTALAMPGDRELSLEAGCAGYISKPIDTRTLATEVGKYLAAPR